MTRRIPALSAALVSLGLLAGMGTAQARVNCTHDGFEQVGDLLVPSPACMHRAKPAPVAQGEAVAPAAAPREVARPAGAVREAGRAESARGAHPDAAWQNGVRQYGDGFAAVGDTTPVFVGLPERARSTQMAGEGSGQPGGTQSR